MEGASPLGPSTAHFIPSTNQKKLSICWFHFIPLVEWKGIEQIDIITVILANLKAEMNKLEENNEMEFKLIWMKWNCLMKVVKWSRKDELARQPIQLSLFPCTPALPNGPDEEREKELTGIAAEDSAIKFINSSFSSINSFL